MKNLSLYLTFLFVAVMCCSMSDCHKRTPGPQTTVHGIIKDFNTGAPIPNTRLVVDQDFSSFLQPHEYTSYDTISTKADGTFTYTFTPDGDGDFNLEIITSKNFALPNVNYSEVKIGIDNKFEFLLQKMINLNLHMVNNSSHNNLNGSGYIEACCYATYRYAYLGIGVKKVDTLFHTSIPRLSKISVTSIFEYGTAAASSTKSTFSSGNNDTTVTVINP